MHIAAIDAGRRFDELLARVRTGNEVIIIEDAGREVAKLVRVESDAAQPVRRKTTMRISEARGLGKEVWAGIDAAAYVERERATWD